MRRIILAGCGHSHLEVIRHARRFSDAGGEVVLLDPGRFWYSGLGSAVLGGRCSDEVASLDPQKLALACGASFIRGTIAGIDRDAREIILGSGDRLPYDLLSLNIGSHVPVPPGLEGAEAVKPIGALPALRDRILASGGHVVVVGGGPTGCEIAGNLSYLADEEKLDLRISLVAVGERLVEGASVGVGRNAKASLERRHIRLRLGDAVSGVDAGRLHLDSGETLSFDHLILATGLAPQPLMHRLGLPTRAAGLRVGQTLASIADDRIFAAGDFAAIEGVDLPKAGVYGVRAGPILARNLLARLEGRPLEPFRPQRRYLSILDLADGTGIAMRGGYWVKSRLALRLKNHLDCSFMERYRRLYAG